MDKGNLSKREILEMIKNWQISAQEGLELFQELRQERINNTAPGVRPEAPETMYFGVGWEESGSDRRDVVGEPLGNVLLLAADDKLFSELTERVKGENGADTGIILVKPGNHYKELGNHIYEINPGSYDDYIQLLSELTRTLR